MRGFQKLFFVVPLAVLVGGCGAIFGGTRQDVRLTSSPDAANVSIGDERRVYTTPASLQLERKNSYLLTFSRDGYEDRSFEIERRMRTGIVILDVLFTGLIGVVVDAATGSWYKLEPSHVDVTLTRVAGSTDGPAQLHVRVQEERGEWRIDSSEPVQVKVEVLE